MGSEGKVATRGISFLQNETLELILFGGKGGVGKTTSAVATALHLARLRPEKKILVISTDPAHSLGDSLDCEIGNEVTPIEGFNNLWALELNADKLFDDFMKGHGYVIRKIGYRGSMFDMPEVEEFFTLRIPGIDEAMALLEVGKIHNTRQYDLILVDTAPTGHTIRLLALPEQLSRWIHLFQLMHEKYRYIVKSFTGRKVKDDADGFLEMMTSQIARIRAFIRNIELAEFVPIVIPEAMSISETERLIASLKEQQISVRNIIINRIAGEGECPFCLSRIGDQQPHVEEMEKKFATYNLIRVPLFPHEVRGQGDLTQFGRILSGEVQQYQRIDFVEPFPQISSVAPKKLSELLSRDLQLILFGGKGGVGKTSLAAATALRMARDNPTKRVLLFSTDPAPSLSDSFGFPIGDKVTPINGNLYALEIDALKMYDEVKQEYIEGMEEAFAKPVRDDPNMGGELRFDKEIMIEFFETSPPGLDEAMALEKIMEFMENEAYDLYILDTAPTGHLLRFLELPQLARERLKVMMRFLLKYRVTVRLDRLAQKWLRQAKNMKKLRATLTDSNKTEFLCVTIPEAMAVLEMEDLLSKLRELEIPCRHLVINMVVPSIGCDFCATRREEQQGYIQQVREMKSAEHIVELPLFPHQIKGMAALTKLAEIAYGK